MNKTIEEFSRKKIKQGLSECTTSQQMTFRRMYSPKDLEKPIEQVVDDMLTEQLDWALTQVENTTKEDNNANT